METVLLVVQMMLAVALIAVILIQRTAQDGGGLTGGGSTMGGLFTARGSANLLTRTTAVLATIFILNSLVLGYIASSQHQTRSIVDQLAPQAPVPVLHVRPGAGRRIRTGCTRKRQRRLRKTHPRRQRRHKTHRRKCHWGNNRGPMTRDQRAEGKREISFSDTR